MTTTGANESSTLLQYALEGDSSGGFCLRQGSRQVATHLSGAEAVDLLEDHMKLIAAERSPDTAAIHAGAVAWRGGGILLPGSSGVGKSTLTAALVRLGAHYYSDDLALLKDGLLSPYAAPLALRQRDGGRMRVSPRALTVGCSRVPLRAVVFTSYRSETTWAPRRLKVAPAITALMAHAPAARRRPKFVLDELGTAIAAGVDLWDGVRGDANVAAAQILETLS